MNHELPGGFVKDIIGYCDPLSVLPGESVGFKLGAWGEAVGQRPEVSIVHITSGDTRPHGTGLIESDVCKLQAPELIHQPLVPGSYGKVDQFAASNVGEVSLKFYPTRLDEQQQSLLSWGAFSISIAAQGLFCRGAQDELVLHTPIATHRWYSLTLTLGEAASGAPCRIRLEQTPMGVSEETRLGTESGGALGMPDSADLYFACLHPGIQHFDGRLEAPTFVDNQGQILAAWDFSAQMHSQTFCDQSSGVQHGELYQTPTRAVKGSAWTGAYQRYEDKPNHYAAIHFHADDLTDAQWQDSISWQVPDELASGMYALKVSSGASEDYVMFFVRAARSQRKDLAFLVPTASYLAYANQRIAFVAGPFGDPKINYANAAFSYAHEDLGYSMYEYHRDRSGVHHSSRLRPIANLKPDNATWAFNADTHITAWLEAIEQDFDVLTDEDLHRDGAQALAGYRAIMTGTHPEYYSSEMREGIETWLGSGGRLMYMGGNGFYWRVAFDANNPAIMEVRRAEDGTRAWIAEPGEYYHQFNGEYGGLWRRLGKPPNQLVGIGFAAQGFDGGSYYKLQPGALNARAEFIMTNVVNADVVGNYGNQGGGAAGEEIDRWDEELGSPRHAIIVATSENHRPGMLRVKEEVHMMEAIGADPKVRADMVFFEVPGGGAVFSTGSISYAGSLAHNDGDNDIAQITRNVLRRFLDPEPFTMPTDADTTMRRST